jgi:chromosome segregation ATPase
MTPDQSLQRLMWLDEEHRKDKAMMGEIVAQLDQHLTQITGVTRGLQDLEERLARVQNQSLRYSQIEQALGQIKTEFALMFEQFEKRVQQRDEEMFKVRQMERERLDRAIEALQPKLDELAAAQRHIGTDHEAIRRVEGGQVAFVRGLEELSKRQEATNGRISVTEEWVKRTGALIAEVQQLSDRLRQDRADALEATRRADQARARQVTEWAEQMKVARREMDDWIAQLRPLLDLPKEVRASLVGLRDLEAQLKQIEPRLVQRQKLNEEFMHKEVAAIKSELETRAKAQVGEWEFMRDEWSKKIAAISQRIDPVDEWRPTVMDEFRQLREKMDADRTRILNILSDVVRMLVDHQRSANTRYDQLASDLVTRVETEKAGAKVKKPASPVRSMEENI